MSAYITRQRTSVHTPGYNIQKYNGPLIPMIMPPLSISFPKDIPSEAMDAIKEKGGSDQMISRHRVFIIPEYDGSFVQIMNRAGAIKTTTSPMNTVNIFCIPILIFLRKMISLFLHTHTYPAFTDPEHMSSLEFLQLSSGSSKRKMGDNAVASSSKKAKTTNAEGLVPDYTDDDEMEDDSAQEPEPSPTDNTIKCALPPEIKDKAWGDETEIPVGHGLFFRYVPELAEFDSRTIPEVISKYFFYTLGTTETDIRKSFEDIRSACGVFSNSSIGQEWSHMFKVFDIGLNCQARLFPIFSDQRYIGTVVSGYNFSISLWKEVSVPVPYEQLRAIVMSCSPHKSIIAQIAELAPSADDSENYDLALSEVQSMMDLRRFLVERAINEKDRDEIRRLAMKLRFKQPYWGISPVSLSNALRLCSEVSDDFPDDLPLHPSMLFEKDRLSVIWSGFGPLAPSLVFTGGPIVDLTSSSSSSGPIAWRQTSLLDAIREMQTVYREKKFAKGQGNRRSGAFKDRLFQGDQAKSIWAELRKWAGVDTTKNEKKAKESGGPSRIEEVYDF